MTWHVIGHVTGQNQIIVSTVEGKSPPAFRLPFKLTQGKWRERMLKNNGDLSIALSSHQSCQKLIDEPLSDKLSVARVCVFDGFEIYKLESFGP